MDPRRTAAELTLRQMGQDVATNELGLFAVLSTYPVHNPHTAYTVIMSPAKGALHVFVRQVVYREPRPGLVRDFLGNLIRIVGHPIEIMRDPRKS